MKKKLHFNFFLVVEVESWCFDLRVCHGIVDYYYLVMSVDSNLLLVMQINQLQSLLNFDYTPLFMVQ